MQTEQDGPVWVFGYGSLVWKTDFPYHEKLVGYLKGYVRRFWQGSIDHRGVPGAPGRVVTLLESVEDCTWGVAYKVLPRDVPDVMMYLDRREVGGYCTQRIKFYPQADPTQPFEALAYIANEHNPNYLGPASLDHIAEQVVRSRGRSGENIEYILELAHAMRTLAPHVTDEHLFSLEHKVLELVSCPGHPLFNACKRYSDSAQAARTVLLETPLQSESLGNEPMLSGEGNCSLSCNQPNAHEKTPLPRATIG
ncbi:hypothetical protein EMCRGX_G032241 [Ephydatia muelleri]|eukprot:Em0019g616a